MYYQCKITFSQFNMYKYRIFTVFGGWVGAEMFFAYTRKTF